MFSHIVLSFRMNPPASGEMRNPKRVFFSIAQTGHYHLRLWFYRTLNKKGKAFLPSLSFATSPDYFLAQLQSFDLQLAEEQSFWPQSHFFEQSFSHLLPGLQQLLSLLPARAADAISNAEPAVKRIRFIIFKFND